MPIDHQPHATATFFELAIALSALSWRTVSSIDHIACDSPRQETARVLRENGIDGWFMFVFIDTRKALKILTVIAAATSIIGLILFGTGWPPLDGCALFWFAVASFILGMSVAAKSEAERMRQYSKSELKAAKPLELFSNGGD